MEVSANHCTEISEDGDCVVGKGGKEEEEEYVRVGRMLDRKDGEVETLMSWILYTGEVKKAWKPSSPNQAKTSATS